MDATAVAVGRRSAGVRPRSDQAALVAVCGLTVLAAIVRFYVLGHQGLWFDEANTAELVHYGPGKMLGLIPQAESTPPLYYMVAWVWVRVFGFGAAGLRSLSAVAGVLVVPVAYAAAAELVSRRTGVICAAFAACNPFLIWYSQEARSYESLVLLTGLALLAFARARRDPTPVALGLWVVAAALSMATHYFAVLAIVPQAVLLLATHRRRRAVQLGVGIAALCGLGLIPLAISQNGAGNDAWIATESLRLRLAQIVPQFLIGTDAPVRQGFKYAGFALVVAALVLLAVRFRRSSAFERAGVLVALVLAVGGFALALLLILAGSDVLITRNLIELWLPAAIVVAAGCSAASGVTARVGGAIAGGLCAIGLAAAIAVAVTPSLQRPDWPGVAQILGSEPAPGQSRVILIQRFQTLLPLQLYLPRLARLRSAAEVSELDVVSMDAPRQPLCWWGAECNLIASPMQPRYAIPGMRTVWVRQVGQFTVRRLMAVRPVTVSVAVVARALTATSLTQDELMIQSPPG